MVVARLMMGMIDKALVQILNKDQIGKILIIPKMNIRLDLLGALDQGLLNL